MEYTIRPVTEEELPALLELYRAYHKELQESGMPYVTNEEALQGVLRTRIRSRLILTAAAVGEDGRLGGFVFCSILRLSNEYQFEGSAVTGYLNDLYVSPRLPTPRLGSPADRVRRELAHGAGGAHHAAAGAAAE